ncbi:MAG: recombinase family protein [Alphaproteobacteria bacterium]|nr:recombinase family protein [Alphaproteobacteria bacterium]
MLLKLLKHLKKGDILIASELSRLGRNLLEVMGILQSCLEKDCQIWTLKENYKLKFVNLTISPTILHNHRYLIKTYSLRFYTYSIFYIYFL